MSVERYVDVTYAVPRLVTLAVSHSRSSEINYRGTPERSCIHDVFHVIACNPYSGVTDPLGNPLLFVTNMQAAQRGSVSNRNVKSTQPVRSLA